MAIAAYLAAGSLQRRSAALATLVLAAAAPADGLLMLT